MELHECREGDVVKVYHDRNGYLTSDVQTMPERITSATVVSVGRAMILLGWLDPDKEGEVPACVWSKEAIRPEQQGYDKFIQGGYEWGFYAATAMVIAERTTMATKRVKCVVNSNVHLTLGKVYEVIHEGKEDYQVKDDDGIESYYTKRRFEVVSDEVVKPTTQAAPTSPPTPQAPPFDFDKYNGITPRRKVHIP